MKWKIHNVFHISLLEQNTTKKGQVDNKALPEPEKKFEMGDDKKYEVEIIIDSMMYSQQANSNQMPGLYYLILWKGYLKEENIWELLLTVIHLRKLISTFYKEHSEKLTAISLSLDSVSLIARPTVLKEPKQKRGHLSKRANKRGKN